MTINNKNFTQNISQTRNITIHNPISDDSDIHLKIDQSDFLRAKPISDAGLNLVWAGVRGTYGVTQGKIAYEVHLSNYNRTNHNQDEKRMHEFRCGWSTNDTSLQLGTYTC